MSLTALLQHPQLGSLVQQCLRQGPTAQILPPVSVPARPTCHWLGLPVIHQKTCGCGEKLRECHQPDGPSVLCTTAFLRSEAERCCRTCPHWEAEELPPPARPPATGSLGVAVGCYGLPQLARVQCRLIRQHCGAVPILLCDDASAERAAFEQVAREEGVEFATNAARLGHYAGDLAVFRRAVVWARELGLTHVAKVSQRCLIDQPHWLAEAVAAMQRLRVATAMQRLSEGSERTLYWRTEAAVLDVAAWSTPAVLAELERDGQRLGNPTELRLNHILVYQFGDQAYEWPLLATDRYRQSPHNRVIFHTHNTPAHYEQVAARFGLGLDATFSTAGWQSRPDWKKG